jgi:hypothetical protein
VSLDGRWLYLGTRTMLSIFDTATDRLVRQIKDVGERGIFPYTMDSRNRIGYICLGNHVGFDVVDLHAGTALHRIFAATSRFPIGRMEPLSRRDRAVDQRPGGASCSSSTRRRCRPRRRSCRVVPRRPRMGLLQPGRKVRMVSCAGASMSRQRSWWHAEGRARTAGERVQVPRSSFRNGKVVQMGNGLDSAESKTAAWLVLFE